MQNENMMKRIPIAVHNENKADCNENFQDLFLGIHRLPVLVVDKIRPVGVELFQLQF